MKSSKAESVANLAQSMMGEEMGVREISPTIYFSLATHKFVVKDEHGNPMDYFDTYAEARVRDSEYQEEFEKKERAEAEIPNIHDVLGLIVGDYDGEDSMTQEEKEELDRFNEELAEFFSTYEEDDDYGEKEYEPEESDLYLPFGVEGTITIDGTVEEFAEGVAGIISTAITDYIRVSRNPE